MNLGFESETLEFKKTTGEIKQACISISSMINKHGVGTVYFGVKPNGDVVGQDISDSSLRDVSRVIYESVKPQIYPVIQKIELGNKNVIKVEVNGSDLPYSAFGKYYLRTVDEDRIITPAELKNIMDDTRYKNFWETTSSDLTFDDIDDKTVNDFYETSIQAGRMPKEKLNKKQILNKIGVSSSNKINNAGRFLFSNDEPIALKMAVFATDEKLTFLDQGIAYDNIYKLLSLAETYILKNIHWKVDISSSKRREIPEIPIAVIREILANSFAHAVYQSNTQHEICIHPSMVTIYNPGSFASMYSPEDYLSENLPSVLRNELISKCLYLSKNIERFGSGLKRIDSFCVDAGLKYKIDTDNVGCKFTIYRHQHQNNAVDIDLETSLNGTERAVLTLLKQNSGYTREELSENISKTVRTVQRALDSLRNKGYIKREGSKSDATWVVLK